MKHLLLNLTGAFLLSGITLSAETLIPAGAQTSWHYWHSAAAPPAAWRDLTFEDAGWPSGPAPLGCDERGLGTRVCSTNQSEARPVTTYFRTTFNVTHTNAPHGLFLMVRADDGVEVCLNGTEVARFNLPSRAIDHSTRARTALESFDEEGSFHRYSIPAHLLRPGHNVLAASVHQWTAPGDDLVFDLALRAPSEPLPIGEGRVAPAAREVTEAYLQRHRVEPEQRIPDGYIDGGRGMHLDSAGRASSTREILLVSRPEDPTLRRHLEFARSPEVTSMAPLDRATRLARYVEKELSLSNGPQSTLSACMLLAAEYQNSPLSFGKMTELCPAGVCRHRALLFKLMADEAGLKVALVRGVMKSPSQTGGHAWNELHLDDGRRLLVDVMNPQRDFRFPSVTEPVARRYLSVRGVPLYPEAGEP